MIDLSQELIFSLILRSLAIGAMLGFLYESVRIVKMIIGTGKKGIIRKAVYSVFLGFTDFIFCLLSASVAILLTYNLSGGVFRGVVYLCMALGLLLYRLTVGKFMYRIELVLTVFFKKVIKTVLKIFFVPIRAIFLLFVRLYGLTIGKIIGKIKCKAEQRRQERKKALEEEEANANKSLCEPMCEKEEDKNVCKREGYKKEGRISFGGRRAS